MIMSAWLATVRMAVTAGRGGLELACFEPDGDGADRDQPEQDQAPGEDERVKLGVDHSPQQT
jgi:hypothetical protein